MREALVKVLG